MLSLPTLALIGGAIFVAGVIVGCLAVWTHGDRKREELRAHLLEARAEAALNAQAAEDLYKLVAARSEVAILRAGEPKGAA